ncbi:fatty acid hydroxylase domain-containing protein 2 [Rhipicephalus microplus]|uniref:fatty acid hydroxylase domain-containing protein 2 n=1 Tax=Rhipicephalus microplus TaxID=6941 RepID=UPI003F6BF30C
MTTSPSECKLASHSTARHNTVVPLATHHVDRKHRYVFIGSLLSWGALLAFAYVWGPSTIRLMKSSGEALRVTLDLNFKKIVYLFRGDYFILTVGGQWVLTVGSYWLLGLLFSVADTSKSFAWMRRYKVQATETKPTLQDLVPVVRQVVFNQVFVQLPVNVLFYWLKDLRGFDRSLSLPSLSRAMVHFACFVAIEEALFYYSHRLLHHRLLYRRFHKKHHEWTAPVAITAVYCTPLEHLLSNVLPVVVGPALLGSHLSVHWLWAGLTAPYGVIVHSGYHLPLLPSPQMHDFHHLTFRGNYDILGILDWLHGTDGAFRQSEAYQRHRLLLSFRPVHELYPDTGGRRDLPTEGRSTTQSHG